MKRFLENLHRKIQKDKTGIADLANRAGINPSALTNLPEQNPNHPLTLSDIEKLSAALNVPAWALAADPETLKT